MFIQNIKCTKCGTYYDAYMRHCPKCLSDNDSCKSQNIPSNILMLDFFKQIVLFLVGWVGLLIISTIISFIFIAAFSINLGVTQQELISNIDSYPAVNFSINISTYLLLFIILASILIPAYKIIFLNLKNKKGYWYGFMFGAILIFANIIISLTLSLLGVGTSGNQKSLLAIINVSPILSLIVLGIIGPICEEITYRLGLFSFIERTGKTWLSYLLTILIFALIHFQFNSPDLLTELCNLPNYLIGGFLLTLAYHKGGIQCSTIAHIMNNVLSISMTIIGGLL